ncbi:MAG: SAP domain-containing protein [Salinivirgaceae bacterium]|nr:SAP domain-containing protein [Salinivirgaceae bacterium]
MTTIAIITICIGVILLIKKSSKKEGEKEKEIEQVKAQIVHEIASNISIKTELSHSEPISCEERIKSAFPDKNGLYPHEILMLHYASDYRPDEKNRYQEFWLSRYGVKDCDSLLNSLVKKGALKNEVNILLNLQVSTIPTLKEVLKNNGLPMTGKKADLVNRILENVEEDKLPTSLKIKRYVISEMGKNSLEESEYVLYIHRHYIDDLDIWKLNQLVNSEPKTSYRNKIWEYLIQKGNKYLADNDFGLYRNIKMQMSNLASEENDFQLAYFIFLEVIYLDINDYLGNSFEIEYLKDDLEHYFSYTNRIGMPGDIDIMNDLQEKLNFSNEKLKSDFIEEWSKYHFPVSIFNAKQCADIYFFEKENNETELCKIYSAAKKKYLK